MPSERRSENFLSSIRLITLHAAITLLAVGIAFKLPDAARYILFQWWPKVRDDPGSLLLTEIALAAGLVILFHLIRFTWDCWRKARLNAAAALVHARDMRDGWLARLVANNLLPAVPWKRDLLIMAVTGRDTFAAEGAPLHEALKDCHEVRVLLLDPYSEGARSRARSLGEREAVLSRFRREVAASIAYLDRLRAAGRKVSLRFYEDQPFWKLVIAGDHVWVQHCHDGRDTRECPEYAFALQSGRPERGFFPAFYSYFLNQWNDPRHADYDFDTGELVYRSREGSEIRRVPYPRTDDDLDQEPPHARSEVPEARLQAAPSRGWPRDARPRAILRESGTRAG